MHTAYYNEYSYHLDRMMEFKVYGHAGRPCLVFPAQSGRFYDFENFGMVGAVQDLLEQGRLQLFTCDSIDWETWAAFDRECRGRIERHEAYTRYIVEELAPRILEINQWSNDGRRDSDDRLQSGGASRREFHVPLAGSVQRHDRLKRHLFQQVVLRQLHG